MNNYDEWNVLGLNVYEWGVLGWVSLAVAAYVYHEVWRYKRDKRCRDQKR